jgi:hypothetical protein
VPRRDSCASSAATECLSTVNPDRRLAAPGQDKPSTTSFAVIGDVPYGADQIAAFPDWVDRIDAEGSTDNLTRITVDGEANNTNSRQVIVTRPGAPHVLSWGRVPYASALTGHAGRPTQRRVARCSHDPGQAARTTDERLRPAR